MIKKTAIIILLFFTIISCGKKDCPKNNKDEKCSELFKKN